MTTPSPSGCARSSTSPRSRAPRSRPTSACGRGPSWPTSWPATAGAASSRAGRSSTCSRPSRRKLEPAELATLLRPLPARAYSIASSLLAYPDEAHLLVGLVDYQVARPPAARAWPRASSPSASPRGPRSASTCGRTATSACPRPATRRSSWSAPAPASPRSAPSSSTGASAATRAGAGCSSASAASPTTSSTSSSGRRPWTRVRSPAWTSPSPATSPRRSTSSTACGSGARDLWSWLQEGAILYLCGDATGMAKDVEAALRRIAVDQGGMTDDKAASLARGAHPRAPVPQGRVLRIPINMAELSRNELLKAASAYLRGTIAEGLERPLTGSIAEDDTQLTKFHGLYLQDDRDLRPERRKKLMEPAFAFMARVRLPGGVCTPQQWLQMDRIATDYANGTLRLTTRQTWQFHGADQAEPEARAPGHQRGLPRHRRGLRRRQPQRAGRPQPAPQPGPRRGLRAGPRDQPAPPAEDHGLPRDLARRRAHRRRRARGRRADLRQDLPAA